MCIKDNQKSNRTQCITLKELLALALHYIGIRYTDMKIKRTLVKLGYMGIRHKIRLQRLLDEMHNSGLGV